MTILPHRVSPEYFACADISHKNTYYTLLLGVGVFVFFTFFYIHIAPILPYNGDDWKYLTQFRDMVPTLARWNPSRVFPEVLHPFTGWAAMLLHACGLTYTTALIASHAMLLAGFLTLLALVMYTALRHIVNNNTLAFIAVLFFFVWGFALFTPQPDGRLYAFQSAKLIIATHYFVPHIINLCFILWFACAHYAGSVQIRGNIHMGCVLLALYFAQFSMTFASATLAGFALLLVFIRLWESHRRSQEPHITTSFLQYLHQHSLFDRLLWTTMVFWIIAALLDMCGGRYQRLQHVGWNFTAAWNGYAQLLLQINPIFVVAVVVIFFVAGGRMFWKAQHKRWTATDTKFLQLICALVISTIGIACFTILVSARTNPLSGTLYATYGSFFLCITSTIMAGLYLLRELSIAQYLTPFVLALFFVMASNPEYSLNTGQSHAERQIVRSWVEAAKQAEARGETSVAITVPQLAWPHPPEWFGQMVARAFYQHGVTRHKIHIQLQGKND